MNELEKAADEWIRDYGAEGEFQTSLDAIQRSAFLAGARAGAKLQAERDAKLDRLRKALAETQAGLEDECADWCDEAALCRACESLARAKGILEGK